MAVCAPRRDGALSRFPWDRATPHGPTGQNTILEIRKVPRHRGRRRSSVVERVIGNDEVDSSILSGGTRVSEFPQKPTGNPTPHTRYMDEERSVALC